MIKDINQFLSISPQRTVATCYAQLWIIAAGGGSNSNKSVKTQCNTNTAKGILTQYKYKKKTWWCINSVHSRGSAHTSTITRLQWVLLTPGCLQLDSGSGSSLLRQLAVGGELPDSSTANLTAPVPFADTVERRHIYIIFFMRGFTGPVLSKK